MLDGRLFGRFVDLLNLAVTHLGRSARLLGRQHPYLAYHPRLVVAGNQAAKIEVTGAVNLDSAVGRA